MGLESDRFKGNDAKQLLDNPLFKEAFEKLNEYLDAKALGCDPDNKEMAQRIIISKQLLAGLKREIQKQVDTGFIAEVQLSELERKRGLLKRVLNR